MANTRKKRGQQRRHQQNRRMTTQFRIGMMLLAIVLVGGLIIAVRTNLAPAASHSKAETTGSFYRDASIQQVADLIRNSDHALVYYRSPT